MYGAQTPDDSSATTPSKYSRTQVVVQPISLATTTALLSRVLGVNHTGRVLPALATPTPPEHSRVT